MNETLNSFALPTKLPISSITPQVVDLNKVCFDFLNSGGSLKMSSQIIMVCMTVFLFFTVRESVDRWRTEKKVSVNNILLVVAAMIGLLYSFLMAAKIYVVGG